MTKMILLTFALVIFAGFSFAHAEIGPTIAELKQTILANDLALQKTIKECETFGFYNISQLAEPQLNIHWKDEVAELMEIPGNLTVDDLSDDQYDTYHLMMIHLKWSSIYSKAGKITDILKINALYAAVYEHSYVFDSDYFREYVFPLTRTQIVDRVLKVIQEEKGVLVNGRFVKSNCQLDNLYGELERIRMIMDVPSFIYLQHRTEELDNICALPSKGCGIELRGAIHNRMVLKEKAENCLPIDSKLKVDKLLAIMADCTIAEKKLLEALETADLDCLFSWGKDPCNNGSCRRSTIIGGRE